MLSGELCSRARIAFQFPTSSILKTECAPAGRVFFTNRSSTSPLISGVTDRRQQFEWMVDTLNSCFEYGICLICCHALLCIASFKNVHAFCHCVSSVTVVLWQKVNLTNNHLIFQNKIGVILCENNWRLIWHIIQHTALASSYWTTKNKGYGFYWPTLYYSLLKLVWTVDCCFERLLNVR